MLTIEQALDEAYNNAGSNAYFGNGFRAGIEFAQRWIPVKEELPDSKNGYINKEVIAFTSDNCAYILIYDDYLGWLPNGTDAGMDNITHWLPGILK